jgi:uncharacterized protein YbjT (DUF2867 family)
VKALVTGGTGTIGRLVVPRLQDAGCDVRVLSRQGRDGKGDVEFLTGDLASGVGVRAAVQGADIIVHCAGTMKGDEDNARRLVEAASGAGTRHLVYISVVGADRIPISSGIDRAMFGYFESKLGAERVIANSGLPWTTLRVTQLHESMLRLVQQLAKLPVVLVPAGWRFQPIEADEVADRLVELASGTASGLVPDLAGPRVYDMADLVRTYLRTTGRHRLILPVWLPGAANRSVRAGANLAPDRAVGRRTWEDFLAARVSSPSESAHDRPAVGRDGVAT